MCCTLQMLGFKQISVEPVVAPDAEAYSLTARRIFRRSWQQYDKLAAEMVKRQKEGRGFQLLPFYD